MAPTPVVGLDRDLKSQLAGMRHRLVDRVFVAAGVLALLYLPVLAWCVHDVGWHFRLQLHAALVGLTFVLVLSLRRLSLPLKSALLVSFFLLLGLIGVFTMGMVVTGYWWCPQAAVLAATLFSIRAGVALAVLCAVLLLLAGAGFVGGTIDLPFDMNQHVRNASAWAAFLVVVMFAPLALLLALGSYQATVERLVAQVNEQRDRLERQVGHDTLTGLPLMRLASDRLEVAIKHALPRRPQGGGAVRRPRRFQGHQRRPRPCRRRPCAATGGAAAAPQRARRGHRGSCWRRRVRRRHRRHHRPGRYGAAGAHHQCRRGPADRMAGRSARGSAPASASRCSPTMPTTPSRCAAPPMRRCTW